MVRIVLPDATPRDTIDDTAAALGLLLLNILPRTAEYPAQLIYLTPDRQALVHLVDEGAGGALAWMIRAEAGADVEARWAEALRGAAEKAS
jgi:hypothetical protein